MSLFSALSPTITSLALPQERLQATSPITTSTMPFTRYITLKRLRDCSNVEAQKRLSYPKPNPVNRVLDRIDLARDRVMIVGTTEFKDALITNPFQFCVGTVPVVTRDQRSFYFATWNQWKSLYLCVTSPGDFSSRTLTLPPKKDGLPKLALERLKQQQNRKKWYFVSGVAVGPYNEETDFTVSEYAPLHQVL